MTEKSLSLLRAIDFLCNKIMGQDDEYLWGTDLLL